MAIESQYRNQVELLLEILPEVNKFKCFAVKGGTAINLFVRNMPRLSVDIDLTYLPLEPREDFLVNIRSVMDDLSNEILNKSNGDYQVERRMTKQDEFISKLFVRRRGVEIKIEPNFVLLGSVFDCESKILCEKAENEFLQSVSANLVSIADLYAGKICAALDRQHPRDLFDIKLLLENEGITDSIRKAFVIYLACSPRPMSELLSPNLLELSQLYVNEFQGMTTHQVTLEELLFARKELISIIQKTLTDAERKFLISVKEGELDMSLLGLDCRNLPALQWKLINLRKMDRKKYILALNKLKRVLEV